jgi:hypothetical protein
MRRRFAMKVKGLLLALATLSLIFSVLPGPIRAQRQREFRVTAYPVRAYTINKDWRDKGPLKDYVVEFDTDQDSHAHLVTSNDSSANEVLRASSISANEVRNGKLIVRVVAGFQARQLHSYGGSVQDFARTLKVEYLTRRGPRG